MKKNFLIEDNYAFILEGVHIDLHNNFDFISLIYSIEKNLITLNWKKAVGDWVKHDEFKNIRLIFKEILSFNLLDNNSANQNSDTVSSVGYLHPDDIEFMGGCLDEQESDETYHMIFIFEGGMKLKIFAEEVFLEEYV